MSIIIIMNNRRIDWIFSVIDYSRLSEAQVELTDAFKDFYYQKGYLTNRQIEILEDIFRQSKVRRRE